MALNFQEHDMASGEMVTVDRKVWLTADKERVVDDGDPQAAILYATPGMQVPRREAERYGLLSRGTSRTAGTADTPDSDTSDGDSGTESGQETASDDDSATKARTPSANKARTRRQDK